MLRVCSVVRITRHELLEIKEECYRRFETFPQRSKGYWYQLAKAAEAILMTNKVPRGGLPVIGPFIGKDIKIPKQDEVLELKAGIEVYSNMSRLLGKPHYERIPRQIRVGELSAGFVNRHHGVEIVDPMIHWHLHGGYKAWTSVKNNSGRGVDYQKAG